MLAWLWAGDLWGAGLEALGSFANLGRRWADFVVWFELTKRTIEPITWLVGSLLALVPGSFAIYKWIYYRYSRLPARLDDMLEREERRLLDARKQLLRAVDKPTALRSFDTPIFLVPALRRAMKRLKWVSWRSGRGLLEVSRGLDEALGDIDTQLKYWEGKRANYDRQRATAYLLRGAIAAANGTRSRKSEGKDPLEHNREALMYFSKALEIEPNDLQALEYVAHQQRILGQIDEALSNLKKLIADSEGPDPENALIRMRALRHLGETLALKFERTGVQARLTEAKPILEDALQVVPTAARDELEHAYAHRALAQVEYKRTYGSARYAEEHALRADRIFSDLINRKKDVEEAKTGQLEVRELVAAIHAKRSQGNGGPPTATANDENRSSDGTSASLH